VTVPNSSSNPPSSSPDAVLVGAGIMSATLAVILKELDPSLKIEIYEVLASEAQESSNAWNNAGTGHAALCELNYSPGEVLLAVDHTGSGHKWRLTNDEPWKRAYVVFKPGADTHFVADHA